MGSLESRSSLDGKVLDGVGLPEHWRKRWLGPLQEEQVEIGPMLGRGGYGKVYKGGPFPWLLTLSSHLSNHCVAQLTSHAHLPASDQ